MTLKDKIHNENRAEPPALPCCVVRPSSSSSTSSFGPTRRRSALLVVFRPHTLSFGPTHRHSALPLGPPPHSWACGAPSACAALPTLPWGGLPRVRLPASSWVAPFPGCTLHIKVGHSTPACGCPHHRGAVFIVAGPYAVSFEPSASFWAALPRRARALVVLWCQTLASGCPTAVFACPRRCVVSNLGVGLPTSLWVSLPRRSLPLVIMWCRTSALGCPSSQWGKSEE